MYSGYLTIMAAGHYCIIATKNQYKNYGRKGSVKNARGAFE